MKLQGASGYMCIEDRIQVALLKANINHQKGPQLPNHALVNEGAGIEGRISQAESFLTQPSHCQSLRHSLSNPK